MGRPDHARARRGARLAVRLILLSLAVLFALGGPLPFWLRRVFPSLSPLSMIASAVSQRGAYAGIFWLAPPLVVLLLAFFKGRLFCRWICPAGTLFSLLSPRQPVARLCRRRWGGLFFWTILGGSLAGLPILLFLEPQPMLQRDLAWFGRALSLPAMIPGLVFPLFLALGAIQPMVWCTHFCPAGHCFDFLRNLRQSPAVAFNRDRRELLAGLFIGVPAAYAAARFPGVGSSAKPPVLPPGARDSGVFGAACHRCYACVDSCPTGVLRASFRPDRPLISWFQPEMQP
ncbi:MAG: 4Fe-4S binding protein, partial [Kiritimatiellae bacterium]|nr:4Fe-4S binding protein [Kiritimatiellia bacterium]